MKFSIVTPAWNVGPWLKETIESVISQEGDFDIEYIVVTDPSTDNTVEIARTYRDHVERGLFTKRCRTLEMKLIELEGSGSMYSALNTGFSAATGDIHAWMPGDDLYQQGAFKSISAILSTFPDIDWIKGYDGIIDEGGALITRGASFIYYQPWIRAGVYGMEAYHVSQETSFWKSHLWKKHGPFPAHMKSMGDYWLWLQFAQTTRLWSADVPISYFRKRPGQDSRVNAKRCHDSMWQSRGSRPLIGWVARCYFYPYIHFLPPVLKRVAERIYPILFPHHPRWYIADEHGVMVKKKAGSFVCRWPVDYNGRRVKND